MPPSPKSIQDKELAELSRIWNVEKNNGDTILANKDLILGVRPLMNNLTGAAQKIQAISLDIATLMENRRGVSGADYAEIAQLIYASQEVENDIRAIFDINTDSSEIQRRFANKVQAFQQRINNLKQKYQNDIIYSKIIDIENAFQIVKDRNQDVLTIGQQLQTVAAAYRSIPHDMIPTFIRYFANLERPMLNFHHREW